LVSVNDAAVHYAAIRCPHWQTIGALVQHVDIRHTTAPIGHSSPSPQRVQAKTQCASLPKEVQLTLVAGYIWRWFTCRRQSPIQVLTRAWHTVTLLS